MSGLRSRRRLLVACSLILVGVFVMLALGVIPAVLSDTYPRAAPRRAAGAFAVNAGIVLAAAITLFWGAMPLVRRGRARFLLVLVGTIIFLTGLALVDATAAFRAHGPHMHAATIFMALGAIGEILVGALTIAVAFRRPKRL
jgi:hypothetical protein